MIVLADPPYPVLPASRVVLVAAVVLAELTVITLLLTATNLDCDAIGRAATCGILSATVARSAGVVVLGALYLLVRLRGTGTEGAGRSAAAWLWPVLQITGALLIPVPLLVAGHDLELLLRIGPPVWALGSLLAVTGALLWLMPAASWWALLRRDPLTPLVLLVLGLMAPAIVSGADLAWEWNPLARVTFESVALVARLFGAVEIEPAHYLITLDYVTLEILDGCSGIQGFALITGLVLVYFWIDRADLNLRRAWILLPIGILLSFLLNVVRITALLFIAARVSPDLAFDGFHGHAGWLMFVLLGLPLVGFAHAVPWVRTASTHDPRRPAPPPLSRDRNAALIVPFMALMLASLVTSTFALVPEFWYPLRVVFALAALAAFLPLLRGIDWWPDAASVGAGMVVGIAWALTEPAATPGGTALTDALAGLPAAWLAVWVAFRVAGSVLLVPLVEEAFFRGYLLARLDGRGWRRVAALLLSAGLFALLHDRWLAALLAGFVFGLAMLRRGRLADAVAAHAAANLVLAALAVARGDWSAF